MMNRTEAENKEITIHWWNFGKKTLDFQGTYKGFFLNKGIKIARAKHPFTNQWGLRFKIPIGCSIITFDTWDTDFLSCFDSAIKLFLTYLGDKTLFESHNRTHKINWR